MAQFYSLDEAAERLGIPVDEYKRRLKTEWTSIRPFRDGATLRFRVADIDELARSLGAASDPGLSPGPVGSAPAEDSADFPFAMSDNSPATPKKPAKPAARVKDEPLLIAADEDIFSGKVAKKGSDSDVRLELVNPRPDSLELSFPTEEIAIDLSGPSSAIIKPSGGSGKLSAPKSGTKLAGPDSARIPTSAKASSLPKADDSSSEFELSLDPSNDSLELELTSDSSEEVDLGVLMLPDDKGGQSGINLGKPKDSGLSLEKKGPKTGPIGFVKPSDSDSDIDFELSLDAAPGASGTGLGRGASAINRSTGPDSDSEFELTLDENSGVADAVAASLEPENASADIFETDFELPSLDDESAELVAEATDVDGGFEVDMNDLEDGGDDSASQVMVVGDAEPILDDDDAPRGRRPRALAGDDAFDEVDLAEGGSASGALRGVRGDEEDYGYGVAPVQTVVAAPAKWGALPAVVLFMTLPLMFVGSLMSYEMVRGMWGYHQPTQPGNLLVRGLAESVFDLKSGD